MHCFEGDVICCLKMGGGKLAIISVSQKADPLNKHWLQSWGAGAEKCFGDNELISFWGVSLLPHPLAVLFEWGLTES